LEYFEDAYDIGYEKIIDTYAAATQHVDQGLSLTLFFKDTATTRDVNKAQIYAWRKGIKTLYYIRLRQMALEGTEVDGCASSFLSTLAPSVNLATASPRVSSRNSHSPRRRVGSLPSSALQRGKVLDVVRISRPHPSAKPGRKVDARSERWREHRQKVRGEIVEAAFRAIERL